MARPLRVVELDHLEKKISRMDFFSSWLFFDCNHHWITFLSSPSFLNTIVLQKTEVRIWIKLKANLIMKLASCSSDSTVMPTPPYTSSRFFAAGQYWTHLGKNSEVVRPIISKLTWRGWSRMSWWPWRCRRPSPAKPSARSRALSTRWGLGSRCTPSAVPGSE